MLETLCVVIPIKAEAAGIKDIAKAVADFGPLPPDKEEIISDNAELAFSAGVIRALYSGDPDVIPDRILSTPRTGIRG